MEAIGSNRPGVGLVAAVAGLALATPVAAWWLVGDRSEPGWQRIGGGHVLTPPELSTGAARVLGVLACSLAAVALALVITRLHRPGGHPSQAVGLVLLVLAGLLAGWLYRVATAITTTANIGGGLALFVGLPLTAVIGVSAICLLLRQRALERVSTPA